LNTDRLQVPPALFTWCLLRWKAITGTAKTPLTAYRRGSTCATIEPWEL
jgi:hypothetical protein